MNPDSTSTKRRFIEGIGGVITIVTGAILLKIGFLMKNLMPPFDRPFVLMTVVAIYLGALGLIVVGVTGVDLDRWGRPLGYGVLCALLMAFYSAFLTKTGGEYLGTDGILFTRYSVDLLLQGENPYAHSMLPAMDIYPIDKRFVTYRVDGSIVDSVSYPALAILAFLPQAILGVPNLNLTTVVVLMLVLVFLVYESPSSLALTPFAIIFVDPNITLFSFGGVFDILWVLPLLFAMKYWNVENYRLASIFVGLAFAVKQTPWFIGPFLAVWLYMESETYEEFAHTAGTCLAYGFVAFLTPNLPFIIWNFDAWLQGTFTPIASGAPLVQQGVGLTMVSVMNYYPLPKSYFTFVVVLTLLALVALYAIHFEKLRWTAWVLPILVLWLNYRSLQNYFIFFVPVAYYAILLKFDLTRGTKVLDLVDEETRDQQPQLQSGGHPSDD